MEKLIAECETEFPCHSMLKDHQAKQDILSFFEDPPYNMIFGDTKDVADIMELMEKVDLPVPVIEAMAYFKDKDYYTYRHILLVFALSTLLAKRIIDDKNVLVKEVFAGPTHDIGKLCVPLEIMKKKTALTKDERRAVEHHAIAGYVLLSYYFKDTQSLSAKIARDHHERMDGSGYPRGVRVNDYLVDIIIVSDIYDALISQRPYRIDSYDNRTAIEEITTMAEEGKVNIKTVQALVAVNRKGSPNYKECAVSIEKRGTPPANNVYGLNSDKS
jgi:HD-GYP domain-containing protein (c-di-GMP phosphodiesterase class II)